MSSAAAVASRASRDRVAVVRGDRRVANSTVGGWSARPSCCAFFGWGLGFYGPPVYLQAVREARGFSLGTVSAAVTIHLPPAPSWSPNVPALYRRFGVPP
jgi:hypothetical protein